MAAGDSILSGIVADFQDLRDGLVDIEIRCSGFLHHLDGKCPAGPLLPAMRTLLRVGYDLLAATTPQQPTPSIVGQGRHTYAGRIHDLPHKSNDSHRFAARRQWLFVLFNAVDEMAQLKLCAIHRPK